MVKQPRGMWLYAAALTVLTALLLAHGLLTMPRLTSPLVVATLLFAVLTFLGERITFRIAGIRHTLAAVVHAATIALLPPPFPLLITLATLGATQLPSHRACYKKVFNIGHGALGVGLASLAYAAFAPTGPTLPATTIPAHPLAVAALLFSYILLDHSLLQIGLLLLSPPPRHIHLRDVLHDGVLPELASLPIGLLGAMLYQVQPLSLLLLASPVIALYAAFGSTAEYADTLERRTRHLEIVLTTAEALHVRQSATDIVAQVAAAARAITEAAVAAAYLPDPDHPSLLERVTLDPGEVTATGPTRLVVPPPGEGVSDEVDTGARAAVVPIEQRRGEDGVTIVGLLRLTGLPAPLSRNDRDVLALLATQAATALENARLHDRALAQASEDGLTGLLNHRAFQTRLEHEAARARRRGAPLAVLMIDLDDFAEINNTRGHQAGDATLAAVGQAIAAAVRATDIAARYGGDEFAVILPETDVDEALEAADRLRAALAALRPPIGEGGATISASIGIAAAPLHGRTREELVRAADQAAYAAKRAGKGRIGRPEDAALTLDERDPDRLAAQLEHANLATVEALAAAVDAKDAYTRGHSNRVSAYALALSGALGDTPTDVVRVRLAGLLHDVGKIGVPDAVLTKPGKLSDEEFAIIKQHPAIGERMLRAVPFLGDILPAVRHHHERWDGAGYPDGLRGEAIPRDAAILAVADSFDAMTSSRTYRPALPVAEAIRRVREGGGTQFDPHVVAAFERAVSDGTFRLPPTHTGELRSGAA